MNRTWWTLGIGLVLLALFLCLLPSRNLGDPVNLNDKVSHALGHAAMAVYFAGLVPRPRWWKIFVFLLCFGVVVEIAQYSMDLGREGEVGDVVANNLGALTGLALARAGLANWPAWFARTPGQRRAP
jgi:VanZ family protein